MTEQEIRELRKSLDDASQALHRATTNVNRAFCLALEVECVATSENHLELRLGPSRRVELQKLKDRFELNIRSGPRLYSEIEPMFPQIIEVINRSLAQEKPE